VEKNMDGCEVWVRFKTPVVAPAGKIH
jgi:hypothetical protein